MAVLPSDRNQSTDLHIKSTDWFLYEGNTAIYWVKLHNLFWIIDGTCQGLKSTNNHLARLEPIYLCSILLSKTSLVGAECWYAILCTMYKIPQVYYVFQIRVKTVHRQKYQLLVYILFYVLPLLNSSLWKTYHKIDISIFSWWKQN